MYNENGYVSELEYTKGYYAEFSVPRMKLALLYAGILPPKVNNAYELGVGHGLQWAGHGARFLGLGTGLDLVVAGINNITVNY